MKFGKVDDPGSINFTLPKTHKQTKEILKAEKASEFNDLRIGCAKWNRADLKNFYPRGTKDELAYYSTQFNSIELNASFYRMFPEEQFEKWKVKASEDFKFFPKVPRIISHIKRLNGIEDITDDFVKNILPLQEKMGTVFLQLREDFGPKNMERMVKFVEHWPKEIPLSIEFRHPEWYQDEEVAAKVNDLMIKHSVSHVITDSAGRRDLVHMRLTTASAFIRYNGANHQSDYSRLDEWLERIEEWHKMGLKNLYFFVHQNVEEASPLLSAYFIEKFNKKFNTDIKIPKTLK